MAKLTKKVLGFSRGKVADVVIRKYRKEHVVSGYQPYPNDPRTNKQLIQRTKFGVLSDLAGIFAPAINQGLKTVSDGTMMHPRNKFMRINKAIVTSSTPGSATISYPDMVIADGNFYGVGFNNPSAPSALRVEVSWSGTVELPGTSFDDPVHVFCYCPTRKELLTTWADREANNASFVVPSHWNGEAVYLYGFVASKSDKYNVSVGHYIGTVTVQ